MRKNASVAAIVATENASRYLQQLCKHWSHRFSVSFNAEQGEIDMGASHIAMTATPNALKMVLAVDDPDTLPRMKEVLAEHLDRFAFREAPLPFVWN